MLNKGIALGSLTGKLILNKKPSPISNKQSPHEKKNLGDI